MTYQNNVGALKGYSLGTLAQFAGIDAQKADQLGYSGLAGSYDFTGLTGRPAPAPPPPPQGAGSQLDIHAA